MKLLAELKRRNVIRMAGLYLVGAWLVVQVAATLLPVFGAPEWVMKVLVGLLALGFLAALVFSWIYELTPEGLKRDNEVDAAQSIAPQTARRMDRMLLAVMALALAYFAFDKFVLAPGRVDAINEPRSPAPVAAVPADSASAATAAQDQPSPTDPKSIAVLAFADLSQAKDQEYFSDGVAEEILNALAKVDELKVAGRTSSFYFKGRSEPLAAIGSTLGVAHVLEGSVRKQGERLRISAKLLRVSDGVELWAETFDGTDGDIFALQERIAQEVTSQLQVALNAGHGDRLVETGTGNPAAYALYLRATEIFNARDLDRYAEAIAQLEQALALDPRYARAWSRMATLTMSGMAGGSTEPFGAAEAKVMRYVEQALAINPGLAEAHAVRGWMAASSRRHIQARIDFERALALSAREGIANFWMALHHCHVGQSALCRDGLDRTLQLDPLMGQAMNWRARFYVAAGDIEAAERMMARARAAGLRTPSSTDAWIAIRRGDLAMAKAETRKLVAGVDLLFAGISDAIAGARVGEREARPKLRQWLDETLGAKPDRISALIPWSLLMIGEIDAGLTVFGDHATDNDTFFLGEVLGTGLYPEVWTSPALPEFLRKTGIAAYWDEFGAPEDCRKDPGGDYRCD